MIGHSATIGTGHRPARLVKLRICNHTDLTSVLGHCSSYLKNMEEEVMKRLIMIMILGMIFTSCTIFTSRMRNSPRVLLFIRDGSADLEFMLTQEVGVMRETIERAGIQVDVATLTGEPIITDSIVFFIPDLKLSDVRVADYQGFILPCMAAGSAPVAPETIALVQEAAEDGKPIAAQFNAVRTLAEAGLLQDKRYAFLEEVDVNVFTDFNGALYAGNGVVQDGNILTSGICPYAARALGIQDGTEELASTLIAAINAGSD